MNKNLTNVTMSNVITKRNFLFLFLFLFLPIILFGQTEQSNDSSKVQKELDGIGKYKIGTTTSIFENERVMKVKNHYYFIAKYGAKGIYKEKESKLPGLDVYYHLDYKVNDEITIDLELRFYNDTLFYISTNNIIRLQSFGTVKLQKALDLAGYLEEMKYESETKTYQNRMGATFEKEETTFRYKYYTSDDIVAKGTFRKYYRKVDEASYIYNIDLYDSYTYEKIKDIEKEKRDNEKQKENNSLIEGL